MSCRGCGMLQALGGMAARGWKRRLSGDEARRQAVSTAVWEMYRLPHGTTEVVGIEMPSREPDARQELFYNADIQR